MHTVMAQMQTPHVVIAAAAKYHRRQLRRRQGHRLLRRAAPIGMVGTTPMVMVASGTPMTTTAPPRQTIRTPTQAVASRASPQRTHAVAVVAAILETPRQPRLHRRQHPLQLQRLSQRIVERRADQGAWGSQRRLSTARTRASASGSGRWASAAQAAERRGVAYS